MTMKMHVGVAVVLVLATASVPAFAQDAAPASPASAPLATTSALVTGIVLLASPCVASIVVAGSSNTSVTFMPVRLGTAGYGLGAFARF
jgi:hypothetical protein